MSSLPLHASFADASDQRASDRRVLRLQAHATTPGGANGIDIHNLSRTGMLVEGDIGIAAGTSIEVELPGGTAHRAQIVWTDQTLAGCRFDTPLTKAQHSAALLRSAPREPLVMVPSAPFEAQSQPPVKLADGVLDDSTGKLPFQKRLGIILALGIAAWASFIAALWLLL